MEQLKWKTSESVEGDFQFFKQKAESRRMLLMEAADYNTHGNTGRKRNKARVKSIVNKFGVLPDEGYLQ